MRFAIFALIALFAFNSASAFFFPDNEIFRPFQRPMQWLDTRINGDNNNRRPSPSWRDTTTRQPWRPLANVFGLNNNNNNNNNDNQVQNNQQRTTMYPPHPKLVAPRPSYMGTSNKLGSWSLASNNGVIPEITNGRMPEFKPEDYYPYGKK